MEKLDAEASEGVAATELLSWDLAKTTRLSHCLLLLLLLEGVKSQSGLHQNSCPLLRLEALLSVLGCFLLELALDGSHLGIASRTLSPLESATGETAGTRTAAVDSADSANSGLLLLTKPTLGELTGKSALAAGALQALGREIGEFGVRSVLLALTGSLGSSGRGCATGTLVAAATTFVAATGTLVATGLLRSVSWLAVF